MQGGIDFAYELCECEGKYVTLHVNFIFVTIACGVVLSNSFKKVML